MEEMFIPTAAISCNSKIQPYETDFNTVAQITSAVMNELVKAGMDGADNTDDETEEFPDVVRVNFTTKNDKRYTTVQWADGTATTVCLGEGETFDRYTGFSAAVMKKLFGSTTQAKKVMNYYDAENIARMASKERADRKAKAEAEAKAAHDRRIKRLAKKMKEQQEAAALAATLN